MKKNNLDRVQEKLDKKYKPYIISIQEKTYETTVDEIPMETTDLILKTDIDGICRDFLNFKQNTTEQNINALEELNILRTNKNMKFTFIEGVFVMQFKKMDQILQFFDRIEDFYKKMLKLKSNLAFYREFHYNQFISEALLFKGYDDKDYFELQKLNTKFKIDNPLAMTEKNIDTKDIEINREVVEAFLKDKIKSKLNKEFKQIRFFNSNYHFKDNTFSFKYLDNTKIKTSDMFKEFHKTHWHQLGDRDFIEQIEDQLERYEFIKPFPVMNFIENNCEFFLNFKKETREDIFGKLKEVTLEDFIENDAKIKKDFEMFLEFKNKILKDEEFVKETENFSLFLKTNHFVHAQLQFFNETMNLLENFNIKSLEDFLKMDLKLFIQEFDRTKEKTAYHEFLEFDYILCDIQGLLNEYTDKELGFITTGSIYLNILNSFGGFWLILFDMINISQGKSKKFELYKTFFSKKKIKEDEYQKRAVFLIFIFSNIVFNKTFKRTNIDFMKIYFEDKSIFGKHNELETDKELEKRIKSVKRFYKGTKDRGGFFEKIHKFRDTLGIPK